MVSSKSLWDLHAFIVTNSDLLVTVIQFLNSEHFGWFEVSLWWWCFFICLGFLKFHNLIRRYMISFFYFILFPQVSQHHLAIFHLLSCVQLIQSIFHNANLWMFTYAFLEHSSCLKLKLQIRLTSFSSLLGHTHFNSKHQAIEEISFCDFYSAKFRSEPQA